MRKIVISTAALVCLLFGCTFRQSGDSSIDLSEVYKVSQKNTSELKKVISYYKSKRDTLKLKAAYYLIANIKDHYHFTGEVIKEYRTVFTKMDSIINIGKGVFDKSWDSLQNIYPVPNQGLLEKTQDVSVIKADLLISNIESSFKAWRYPWARKLSFDDFCKYILPYKLADEEPEVWKSVIQKDYSWLLDSMKNDTSSLRACNLLNQKLKKIFYINARVRCNWDMNYSEMKKTHTGKCSHASQYATYVMRAMGLPVVMDYTPYWANKDVGHQWNSLLSNHKNYIFMGAESDPGKTKIVFTRSYWIKRKRAKVFRFTYASSKQDVFSDERYRDQMPESLGNPHLEDVTNLYFATANVSIRLNGDAKKANIAYLCVFNERRWRPIASAKIGYFNKVVFKDMGKEIVYLPAYYIDNKIVPAHEAIVLCKNGTIRNLNINRSVTDKTILSKKYPEDKTNVVIKGMRYELFYWDNSWISLGKKIAKGANIAYDDVPGNALLWLRNINIGKQERIFTYEDGKQVWW